MPAGAQRRTPQVGEGSNLSPGAGLWCGVERRASRSPARVDTVTTRDVRLAEQLSVELPRLLRIARLLTGDDDVADDVVAEAIARTLPLMRADAVVDLPAYLRRVIVNLAARRWRRRALGARRDHLALAWMQPASDVEGQTVERDRVVRALLALPVRRRAVVVLRFYDDLPEADIAAAMGTSVGAVKSQLSRGLEQLRSVFEAQEQS